MQRWTIPKQGRNWKEVKDELERYLDIEIELSKWGEYDLSLRDVILMEYENDKVENVF